MMKFALVVAVDKNNGIGKNNTLAWKLPTDMKFFADMTTRTGDPSKMNAVIMGRNTWESLPKKHRPLDNRINVVLSRSSLELPDGVILADSMDAATEKLKSAKNLENVFVIGGAKVFEVAIKHPECRTIYLTRLEQNFDCDVFFPAVDENIFKLTGRSGMKHENGIDFEFLTYERKPDRT